MNQSDTGKTWSNLFKRELTQEEVKEIAFNVSGFLSVLQELADEEDTKQNEVNVEIKNEQANNH